MLGKTETDAMAGETRDCDYKQLRQERGDWCCVSSYETGTVADYKIHFLLVKSISKFIKDTFLVA